MKILHLTHSSSRNAGGLFNSVRQLALQTAAFLGEGGRVDVASFADEYSKQDSVAWGAITPRHYVSLIGPTYGASPRMLFDSIQGGYDVVHAHGIWSSISCVAWACGKFGAKVVVSPRGMVDPWILQRSRYKKRLVGAVIEKRLMRSAHVVHALTDAEVEGIRSYCSDARIARIPNAVSDISEDAKFEILRRDAVQDETRPIAVLYLGRLHEKKGVEELISAFQVLRGQGLGARQVVLNIFGWGEEGFVESLRRQIVNAGLADQVFMRGPAFGGLKVSAFAQSDLFILPSRSEGLPMAALEAASAALPLLLTDECNLPEFFNKGAIRIDLEPRSIANGIQSMLESGRVSLARLGGEARDVFVRGFSWSVVLRDYMKIYE